MSVTVKDLLPYLFGGLLICVLGIVLRWFTYRGILFLSKYFPLINFANEDPFDLFYQKIQELTNDKHIENAMKDPYFSVMLPLNTLQVDVLVLQAAPKDVDASKFNEAKEELLELVRKARETALVCSKSLIKLTSLLSQIHNELFLFRFLWSILDVKTLIQDGRKLSALLKEQHEELVIKMSSIIKKIDIIMEELGTFEKSVKPPTKSVVNGTGWVTSGFVAHRIVSTVPGLRPIVKGLMIVTTLVSAFIGVITLAQGGSCYLKLQDIKEQLDTLTKKETLFCAVCGTLATLQEHLETLESDLKKKERELVWKRFLFNFLTVGSTVCLSCESFSQSFSQSFAQSFPNFYDFDKFCVDWGYHSGINPFSLIV